MANEEHLARLKQGVEAWNQWRQANRDIKPDLAGADLRKTDLGNAHLVGADLLGADLAGADLTGADLTRADLHKAVLLGARLAGAGLGGARLLGADLRGANLVGVDLRGANLGGARLAGADFGNADLRGANLGNARLTRANLRNADLTRADLGDANLLRTDLARANLTGANLRNADLRLADLHLADLHLADLELSVLVETNFEGANLTGCSVYGISAWNVNLVGAQQWDLVITRPDEQEITVDNLEVAQFIYLLLHNDKIREVIDNIGKKGVLILGRFAGERKAVLNALRTALRGRGFLPMVFDFEKPTQRDFTETIMTLAGLSLFVIADITNPRSTPLELQATVPDYMIPFVPIIAEGEPPFAMFIDLQRKFDWVLDVLTYDSIDHLLAGLQDAVIVPALQKHEVLVQRRAQAVGTRHILQYLSPYKDVHP